MEVQLTEEQGALIRYAIESGRVPNEGAAVNQALDLWVERERRRIEILAAVEQAEIEVAAGHVFPVTADSMRELAERVKQRGMARLEAEKNAAR